MPVRSQSKGVFHFMATREAAEFICSECGDGVVVHGWSRFQPTHNPRFARLPAKWFRPVPDQFLNTCQVVPARIPRTRGSGARSAERRVCTILWCAECRG